MDEKADSKEIDEALAKKRLKRLLQTEEKVCPHCGRCPVCGRGAEHGWYPYPYLPWPSTNPYPTYTYWGGKAGETTANTFTA